MGEVLELIAEVQTVKMKSILNFLQTLGVSKLYIFLIQFYLG